MMAITYEEFENKINIIKGIKEDLEISGAEAIDLFKYLNGDNNSSKELLDNHRGTNENESDVTINGTLNFADTKLKGLYCYDLNKMLKQAKMMEEAIKNTEIVDLTKFNI